MTVTAWMLVFAFYQGTVVIPVSYSTEEACDFAAHEATADHPGPIANFCVPVETPTPTKQDGTP